MQVYLIAVMFILGFLGSSSSYADESCPHNKDILEYDDKVKKAITELNSSSVTPVSSEAVQNASSEGRNEPAQKTSTLNAVDEIHAHMGMAFEELSFDCAQKLVGQGVDNYLFMSGFPDLITFINSDRIVNSIDDVFLYGDHRYFIKNNERILAFLQREERKKWFFMRWFQNMDRWYKIHDFALAAKFSLEEEGDLAEMKLQAKRAYNPLDFALYLPIWQGQERREQFTQLCLELGCKLDAFQECSPGRGEDLWTVKANYLANLGNIARTGERCIVSAENNGKYQELLPLSNEDPLNYVFNFRKIGIMNSNCASGLQVYHIKKGNFTDADNCVYVAGIFAEE